MEPALILYVNGATPPDALVMMDPVVCPHKIAGAFAVAVRLLTVTVAVAELEQPANEYVTVYVVVDAGFTVILCVVAPPGDHEYVPPGNDGVAVNVAFCPAQIADELTATVGIGFTVTVPVALPVPTVEHPDKV